MKEGGPRTALLSHCPSTLLPPPALSLTFLRTWISLSRTMRAICCIVLSLNMSDWWEGEGGG